MIKHLATPRSLALVASCPIIWGILSIIVFSILGPWLPSVTKGLPPKWLWLWLLQMALFIPIWKTLLSEDLQSYQRNSIGVGSRRLPLGSHNFYLVVAYFSATLALVFHGTWFSTWLVFGGIVSPIFEELFTRNLLAPWLRGKWSAYLLVSLMSSVSFSLMHWGYNGLSAFQLPLDQQFMKFWGHFQFSFILGLVFRFTRSVQVCIWLHMASNLQFILTKI